jgi:TfoX/Sxy family transcriptional regulator of competence genes
MWFDQADDRSPGDERMATDVSFVEYVTEQAGLGDRLGCKRMFGEYGLYIDGKIVAFVCDNSLFVKAAGATDALTANLPRRPPYPGAKPYPVADELLDDAEQLQALLVATAAAMPEPKPRKKTHGSRK